MTRVMDFLVKNSASGFSRVAIVETCSYATSTTADCEIKVLLCWLIRPILFITVI